ARGAEKDARIERLEIDLLHKIRFFRRIGTGRERLTRAPGQSMPRAARVQPLSAERVIVERDTAQVQLADAVVGGARELGAHDDLGVVLDGAVAAEIDALREPRQSLAVPLPREEEAHADAREQKEHHERADEHRERDARGPEQERAADDAA